MESGVSDFATASRSRSRRAPTNLSTRFDLNNENQKLYSRQNEFVGGPIIGPHIIVDTVTGDSRPLEQRDFEKKPFASSETRESDEGSSIHQVQDLGFGAAANGIPSSLSNFNDIESLKCEAFAALQGHRKSACSSSPEHYKGCKCIEPELRMNVQKRRCWSSFDKNTFLPLDAFEELFDIKSIMLLLAERHYGETHEGLWSKFVTIFDPQTKKSRRRILGILVYMKSLDHFEDFVREDITDDDLPFKLPESHEETLSVMETWDGRDVDLFFLYQSLFFVPFFDIGDQRLLSYDLHRDIRLPWQKFQYVTSGGTGIVHQVEIHPSHHNFSPHGNSKPVFALKEIDAIDQKAYNEELSALEKTCAQIQKEKHLIKLLLTFRHGEKFYLLFEWADGSLEKFWKSNTFKVHDSLTEKWAVEQCLGLAQAVSRIHGLRTWQKKSRSLPTDALHGDEREWGRHGDIKPDNILWFKEHDGHHNLLVLSDLGLTRYHTRFSRSFVHRSQIDGCTRTYRPPELDMGRGISQLYDIWSLGCVFLEFCIWYLHGHSAVQVFAMERMENDESMIDNLEEDKFFLITEDSKGGVLKDSVKKRIATLKDDSTVFTKELLDVIEDRMLRCDPKNRSRIDEICTDLRKILDSIPKPTTTDEVAQIGAFFGAETTTPYPPSISDISYDETSSWTLESPGASKQDMAKMKDHHDDYEASMTSPDIVALETTESHVVDAATIQVQDSGSSSLNAQVKAIQQISTGNTGGQRNSDQRGLLNKSKRNRRNRSSRYFHTAWNAIRFWN